MQAFAFAQSTTVSQIVAKLFKCSSCRFLRELNSTVQVLGLMVTDFQNIKYLHEGSWPMLVRGNILNFFIP